MELIEMETLPKGFEKLGREVKVRNSHKRLEQSTWVEVEVDMDWNEDSDVLEFHVDDHETLEVFISPFGQKYGGNLQFDFPLCSRPIMLIGQDESSNESNLKNSDTWVDKDGKGAMYPKGRGYGYMVSQFIAREWGISLEITEEILRRANAKREDEEYTVSKQGT